jgi:hypothetical protein
VCTGSSGRARALKTSTARTPRPLARAPARSLPAGLPFHAASRAGLRCSCFRGCRLAHPPLVPLCRSAQALALCTFRGSWPLPLHRCTATEPAVLVITLLQACQSAACVWIVRKRGRAQSLRLLAVSLTDVHTRQYEAIRPQTCSPRAACGLSRHSIVGDPRVSDECWWHAHVLCNESSQVACTGATPWKPVI